ncbi:MAG: asparagine synthase (glutamine-hydrolyzing) [Ferruginibacter sp.]|nr:asparagine synthase (glutamine-hydrolyzing) [Ferruginibacter sp.]
MCGIAGIISFHGLLVSRERVNRMTESLAHRGPDGQGFWTNSERSIGLGHRRLSVIDLSDAAAQPMHFKSPGDSNPALDPRYTITYNGEIYNYLEIREVLKQQGYQFRTHSDTEVILAAYDCWKEECLSYFDGMFSFAIWDNLEKTLFAARDRFGEKPFYFYEEKDFFVFASEMKALWVAGVEKKADDKMLLNYLALGYVQNANNKGQTFFEKINSLPPAHYLKLSLASGRAQVRTYWELDKEKTLKISSGDALDKYIHLFRKSVTHRLRSDVRVGTSLSGGLDSSSIIATISEVTKQQRRLPSFSAVFPGFEKDESVHIDSVVKKFRLQNHRVTPTAEGFIRDFQALSYHQEEPFTSSSIYAQYKVFELVKQQDVKVLLDGQGADETLAGYHKYIHWYLQQLVSRRKFRTADRERKIFRQKNIPFKWGTKNYFAAYFPAHTSIQLEKNEYYKTVSQPDINPDFIVSLRGREWEGIHKPIITKLNDILYFNTQKMGLEELLRFADRNSMAHGREVRLPFLNHELVEFLFSLPADFKIHNGWTKWLLRSAMSKKLPTEIVWRNDKIGYETPQAQWMQDLDLQDFMHEAKRKLVNGRILKNSVLNKKITPLPAHDADNFDFRYLCAAQII